MTTSFFTAQGVLLLMTVYFGYHQLKQLGGFRTELFDPSTWHIVDLAPLLLVTASILMTVIPFTQGRTDLQRYLNSIAAFGMWLKVFDFLRVNRSFAHMIKLLMTVMFDMTTYITLLLVALIAFAGTFYILSNNQQQP